MGTRINEYPSATALAGSDKFVVDGAAGTRSLSMSAFPYTLIDSMGSAGIGLRNQVIRGKNLGTSLSTTHANAIANGVFTDLFLGDYWTDASGELWLIGGFNYQNPLASTTPHVYLVSAGTTDTMAYNTRGSGYYSTATVRTYLHGKLSNLQGVFGSTHIKTYTALSSTSATANETISDMTIELLPYEAWKGIEVGRTAGRTDGLNQLPILRVDQAYLSRVGPSDQYKWCWFRDMPADNRARLYGRDGSWYYQGSDVTTTNYQPRGTVIIG